MINQKPAKRRPETPKRRARAKRLTVLHKSEAKRRRRIMKQAAHFEIKVPGKEKDHEAILGAIRAFCRLNKQYTAV